MPHPVENSVARASAATISRRGSKLGCMAKTSSKNAVNYNDSSVAALASAGPIPSVDNVERIRATIPDDCAGLRLDQALARLFPAYSRSRLQAWLKDGTLKVDGLEESKSKVAGGEEV